MIATDRFARVALGVALGVVIGIAASSYRATRQLMAVQESLAESQAARAQLHELLFELTLADSARQAYLQHGDYRDLRLYYSAANGVSPRLRELRPLFENSPAQQRNYARFEDSVDERLARMNQSLWAGTNDSASALHRVAMNGAMSGEDGLLAAGSVALADQLDNQERQRLQTLATESRHQYRYAVGSLTLGTMLSLLLVVVVYSQGAREQKQRIETEELLTGTQGGARIIRDLGERKRVEEELQQREELMNAFFRTSPVGLAIFDTELRCQKLNGTLRAMVGQTVQGCLGKSAAEVLGELGSKVEVWLREVAATGRPILNRELIGRKPNEPSELGYWITSCFPVLNQNGQLVQLGVVMLDITERTKTEEALRESEAMLRGLSGHLLKAQDAERRRLARELHDGIGQCLAALKINLEILEKDAGPLSLDPRVAKALAESRALADQCLNDTRTISHLLHPPLLDQVGLLSALRWYVHGFVERSEIRVHLDLPDDDSTRLPADLETTLFRVVQESLTNIHRHSGSPAANIRLTEDAESVSLEVTDYGHGIPPEQLWRCNGGRAVPGVGIAGMRERVRQFGGQLQVSSSAQGTTIKAVLPVGGEA